MNNSDIYRLSVVIINYNTAELTINCLASLIPQLDDVHSKVIVVDNASTDSSSREIADWITENSHTDIVDLVLSPTNLGFSGGNNLGLKHCKASYYLLLNSDTILRENAIAALLTRGDSSADIGLVSPRLEWPDGSPQKSCFRCFTPISELIEAARTRPITRFFQRYDVPLPVLDTPSYPEWTSFACVLIKAKVFEDIGPMDAGYFMYFEDASFCCLARTNGWSIVNEPAARVIHLRGGSSSVKRRAAARERLPRYYYVSRSRYYYTQFGRAGLTTANLLWWIGRSISKIREWAGRSDRHVCQSQWRDIWINWRDPTRPYEQIK